MRRCHPRTVFKITPSGALPRLVSFDGTDGTLLQAGLVRPVGAHAQEILPEDFSVELDLPNANEARRPRLGQPANDSDTELVASARLAGLFHRNGEGALGQTLVACA